MSDVEPKERHHWWTTPKAIIVFCCAVIAGAAALIKNLNDIKSAFGFGVTEVHIAHAIPFLGDNHLALIVQVVKAGPNILRDCKFTVSINDRPMELDKGTGSYVMPTGAFVLSESIGGTLPHWYFQKGDKGLISFNCSTGGSPSFAFTVR